MDYSSNVSTIPENIPEAERNRIMHNIHDLLKNPIPLDEVADVIVEGTFLGTDIERKDSLDRFLDYVIFKVKTGLPYIPSLAYPTMRIDDHTIENKVIMLINEYLIPEIIIKVLKYLTRNVQDSDTNLYLAHLITSEMIIGAIFDTYKMFLSDVQNTDREQKTLNVKRLQQFSSHTDNRFSSPLDAACRLRYVLEYFHLIGRGLELYSKSDLLMGRERE